MLSSSIDPHPLMPAHHHADLGLGPDPFEQMARADAADWVLLRLVSSVAMAVLVLALASSLHA